jgi:cytochrome P450
MIALGTLLLFEHPDQMKLLKDDPSLSPSAVEEMLRYLTIPHFNSSRVAVEDVEISGHRIESGEGVIASLAAANRDPAVFPDPDVFDITRDATKHLAFADGIHQCVGQPIARLELQVVFATLFQRIPALRLAVPFEDIVFSGNTTAVYGLRGLPVTW